MGKRTAQKDTTIDTTSDSQVNSNFPYRWSPASLTFNNCFYLFLYLYITWITINNNAPQAIECDFCDKCANLSDKQYHDLGKNEDCFFCSICVDRLPDYSDFFFENVPVNMFSVSEDSCNFDLFEELIQVRKSHPHKLITAHLNVNSIRYKFDEIKQIVPRRLFCFGSLVILDVARCYLWLFTLYINIKIGKNSC